jgi:hypothetical protein
MMNSFDVFDTLVGRRTVNNDAILTQLGMEKNIMWNFLSKRKAADTGSRSLKQIYEALANEGVIEPKDIDWFVQREIDLEISLAFPITRNIKRVKDGDVLVSDMYLPAYGIMAIVRACGLDKQVTLYQSNGDKANGSVWKKFHPDLHLGDNIHSDVNMPRAEGINAEHFVNPHIELTSSLSLLTREIKLRNVHTSELATLSADFNVPFLLLLSEYLHKNFGHRNIVFLGRDCYLLHKIYTAYYETAYYVPFSRKLAYNDNKKAIHYLETHSPPNALYFDLSSTGATWEHLAKVKELDILVAYLSDQYHYTKEKPVLPERFDYILKNSEHGQTNEMLELMNTANHGSIESVELFDDRLMVAKFAENEIPSGSLDELHSAVNIAQSLAPAYRHWIRQELEKVSNDDLKGIMSECANEMCKRMDLYPMEKK